MPDKRYRCPCCGHRTLESRKEYDRCPVCWWVDDGQDDPLADEMWGGPNANLSLTQARRNYARYGACDERFVPLVRPAEPEERSA